MPYVSDGGFTPTLALVSLLPQTVTLIARSGLDGAERCNTTLEFVGGEHMAFLLQDVLPCTATGEGSLEIRGCSLTPALSGIGFLANDEGAFVTQPIWASSATMGEGCTPAPPPMSPTVEMPGVIYTPAEVTIQQGGTVTWENTFNEQHSATSDSGFFDTEIFSPGEQSTLTFNTAGSFPYHCTVHGFAMTGTITVLANGGGGDGGGGGGGDGGAPPY